MKDYYRENEQRLKMPLNNEGLLIVTPEKLNLILRKWRDYRDIIERISLVLLDEIHFIEDENRGRVFESMITRLLFLSQT